MHAKTGTPAQVRGPGWVYEVKWDGYRTLVGLRDGKITLTSRNGVDLTGGYPELQAAAELIAADSCVLDGEIVALDEQGRPRFSKLQNRARSRGGTAHLMLFDVLEVDGESQLDTEYEERRIVLESLVTEGPLIHVPPQLTGSVDDALQTSRTLQLEGIVAKRTAGKYLPGARSTSWVKIKHVQTQEVVIVGWSPGEGNRAGTIGSLLMAVPSDGDLKYVGKVGSGFNDSGLREAAGLLAKIERRTPQVSDVPAVDAKGAHWVTPLHVGEVSYAEWTDSHRLRQPVWKGWRPDKQPTDVRREDES
jgi:bifunctional non-homologous end joining protein LigD